MSIKLDLTKFKHVESDEHSSTLQHKDGHTLRIAHKTLSPQFREQLEAIAKLSQKPGDKGVKRQEAESQMANGGRVEDKKKSPQTIFAHNAESGVKAANEVRKVEELPNGATILLEGDEDSEAPRHDKDGKKSYGKIKGPDGKKPKPYAEGGQVNDLNLVDEHPAQGIPASLVDTGAAQQMLQFDPSKAPPMPAQGADPELARKRELYNQVNALSLQDSSFGKDGQSMPQHFNPDSWSKAERMFSQEQAQNADRVAADQQRIAQENQARTAAGLPAIPMPNVPVGQQPPGGIDNQPQRPPDQLPPQQPGGGGLAGMTGDVEGMMQHGFQQRMQGIEQQSQAQQQLGQQQEQILQERQNAVQDAQIAYQRHYDELDQERKAFQQDVQDGHIDPNKYWSGDKDGNGGHSRIMSAIGMIVAGFNPTSQPNAAVGLLKQQMEMNLQAQKENLGAKQNLLTANMRQFGNLKDAMDMTRLMQNDMAQAQLQQAAAKASTPQAKAAALTAAGQLQMEAAPMFQQFAMRRAMLGLADSGDPSNTRAAEQMIQYARMTNPEMAKEMEGRLIPGVGMAKVPVPDGVRQELVHKQALAQSAQELLAYSKTHTNLIPGTPEYNYGAAKALALQQKVREGMLGGVFKEAEKPLLEKFVTDNPAGAMKAFSTQPQLKAIIEANNSSLNTLKSAYGLPQMATPQGASGPVKGKDGKMYIQQGNFMVPYKAGQKGK